MSKPRSKTESLSDPSPLESRLPILNVVGDQASGSTPTRPQAPAAADGGRSPLIIEMADDGSFEIPPEQDEDEPPDLVDEPPAATATPATPAEDEPTLMDEMMNAATAARKLKKDKAAAEQKRVKKEFGAGFKGGFLMGGKAKTKAKAKRSGKPLTTASEPLTTIKYEQPTGDPLQLEEVQDAMQDSVHPMAAKLQQGEWCTPDLMQRIASNPRLAAGLANPKFAAALGELQKNPKAALKKFQHQPEMVDFLNEFCGVMGDHFTTIGKQEQEQSPSPPSAPSVQGPLAQQAMKRHAENEQKKRQQHSAAQQASPASTASSRAAQSKAEADQQAQVDRIMQDAELRTILMDPEMQQVMVTCQQPGALGRFMRDPHWGPKLRKLADAGLVRIAT